MYGSEDCGRLFIRFSFYFRTFSLHTINTAKMNTVKGIPYGVARFEEVRNENFYYVDKIMFLPLLEDTGKYLFLIRSYVR